MDGTELESNILAADGEKEELLQGLEEEPAPAENRKPEPEPRGVAEGDDVLLQEMEEDKVIDELEPKGLVSAKGALPAELEEESVKMVLIVEGFVTGVADPNSELDKSELEEPANPITS